MFDLPQTPTSPAFSPTSRHFSVSPDNSTSSEITRTTAAATASLPIVESVSSNISEPAPQTSPSVSQPTSSENHHLQQPPSPPPPPQQRGAHTLAEFRNHVTHLASKLQPLLSVSTGQTHAAFPRTLLQYHVLTEAQLDDLAHFYHQRSPSAWSLSYPAPVVARWHVVGVEDVTAAAKRREWLGSEVGGLMKDLGGEMNMATREDGVGIEAKRRRFGRFVGLRGCESPVEENDAGKRGVLADSRQDDDEWESVKRWVDERLRRGMAEELEREIRRAKGF